MKLNLANLQSTWRAPGALALSIEANRISVDWLRRDNGGSRLLQSVAINRGGGAILEDPQRVGRELASALTEGGIRERRCVICVPPSWALVTSTELPGVTGEDLRSYFELCAERAFPIPIGDLHLSHCSYQLPNGRQAATLAALSAKRMNAVKEMLAAAGCRAISISLGLDACLPDLERAAPGTVHFLANGQHVDVVITAGGGIAGLRSLPLLPEDARAGDGFDSEGMGREIRLILGRLPGELRDEIREARFAGTEGSAALLFEETRKPLERLGIRSLSPDHGLRDAAVGATRQHLLGQTLPFEFVAPQQHRWQIVLKRLDTRRHRWLVALALGFVVLPLVVLFVRSQQERRLEAHWSRIQPTVAELESVQANIRQFRSWFDVTPRSVQVFNGLVAAFPETGDVWARTIEFREGSRIACAGLARNQAAWLAFLDRLRARPEFRDVQVQQVRGENPIQFTFTCVWVPTHEHED